MVIGYTISSSVLIGSELIRNGGLPRHFDRRGARWFAAVGICNGLGVFSTYAALGYGPVTLDFTAGRQLSGCHRSAQPPILLKNEPMNKRLIVAVTATVGGVVLLLVT